MTDLEELVRRLEAERLVGMPRWELVPAHWPKGDLAKLTADIWPDRRNRT